MDKLDTLRVFCQIVESGGLGKAANVLGLSPTAVTQSLARLESLYGTRLIERTTRTMIITDAGKNLYERALQLLEDFQMTQTLVRGTAGLLKGKLRVTLPLGLAMTFIYPHLPDFFKDYPDLDLDLQISDRFVDLAGGNFDVGLRVGILPDADVIAIPLLRYRRLTCASPLYLEAHGYPETPEDLARHSCLLYRHDQLPVRWRYWVNGQITTITLQGRYSSNETHALLTMARAGLGIMGQPEWLIADDLRQGRLVTVLDDFVLPVDSHAPGIFAVLPSRRYRTAKTQAFIDFARRCIVSSP